MAAAIPKDQKKRENFYKSLVTQDERLGAKVAKVKSIRNQEEIPIELQLRAMSIEEDPLREVL